MPAHPVFPALFHDGNGPVVKTAAKLALGGVPASGFLYEAKWRPYCDDPVPVFAGTKRGSKPVETLLYGPCRRCEKCLRFRSMKWRQRAINETLMCHQRGRRTWCVSLTFSPVHLAGIMSEARSREIADIDAAAYVHVRRYLDRLRKASKSAFRYLAVFERGEISGRPHYHVLLHECGPNPLLKRTLDSLWRSIVHARLVRGDDDRSISWAATYVSKYATKAPEVRLRASARYGHGPKAAA